MVRALRVVTVERGVDPRRFALLPFGGAGPMHAAAIAEELGIDRILCPRAGGVLSAFGLCASERRRDTARTVMLAGADFTAERVASEVASLVDTSRGRRDDFATNGHVFGPSAGLDEGEAEIVYELRYAGQAFELPVPGPGEPDPADLAERFEALHEERYGHRDPDGEVVLVDVRLALVVPGPEPRPVAASAGRLEESSRRVRFNDEWIETPVLRGEPESGRTATGPVIFELPEATLVLPPSWNAKVDEFGTICAMRSKGGMGDPERTSPAVVREGSPMPPHPEAPQ
jgi:N-methylhydantoinase A